MTTKFVDSFLSNFAYETIDDDTRMLTTGAYKGICVSRNGKISGENFKIEVKEFIGKHNMDIVLATGCIPFPAYKEEYEFEDMKNKGKIRNDVRFVIRNFDMIQLWLIHALVWYDDDAAWIEGEKGERGRNFAVIAFMRLFKNKQYCKLINSMYRKCDPTKECLFPLYDNIIFNLSNAACYFPDTREQLKKILNEKVNFEIIDHYKANEKILRYTGIRSDEDVERMKRAERLYENCPIYFFGKFKDSLMILKNEYKKYVESMIRAKELKWTMC